MYYYIMQGSYFVDYFSLLFYKNLHFVVKCKKGENTNLLVLSPFTS